MNTQEAIEILEREVSGKLYDRHPYLDEALTHAIECMKRGQWQDISTAPKDGAGVLLYIYIADNYYLQYTGSYHDGHWWVTNFSGEDEYWYMPTHWMPLPEQPQERKY